MFVSLVLLTTVVADPTTCMYRPTWICLLSKLSLSHAGHQNMQTSRSCFKKKCSIEQAFQVASADRREPTSYEWWWGRSWTHTNQSRKFPPMSVRLHSKTSLYRESVTRLRVIMYGRHSSPIFTFWIHCDAFFPFLFNLHLRLLIFLSKPICHPQWDLF